MKTFKIIGLIALLIVLFEFIGGFNDGWNDVDKLAPISMERTNPAFMEGLESAVGSRDIYKMYQAAKAGTIELARTKIRMFQNKE